MGIPVLIMGFSGSGKSTSMRNFGKDELALVNVNSKPLPFRTHFTSTINSDNYADITGFIRSLPAKSIVIDDAQYLILNEFMRRSKETGYQKYTDIGRNFWELVRLVEKLPPDVVVYFLQHIETGDDGRLKAKTIGKLLDNQINVEGMFSIVLKTLVVDGKYLFATQTDGSDTCKSPVGLFETMYIPNDLKAVDVAIRGYYSFSEGEKCDDCGNTIIPANGKTVEAIIDGSMKTYGRKMCWSCVMREFRRQKEAEK
ncbi:MAG: ATP-binding protein [Ruminococcus flavefaciens]|nr:ATP-binding protein [Ruminococcus flavefaciens]